MYTSVFREILDHSLTGDKTYGGTLSVDTLNVPTAEESYNGSGAIDGNNINIGLNQTLGLIKAQSIIAGAYGSDYSSILIQDIAGFSIIEIGQSSASAYINIYQTLGVSTVQLGATKSYFVNQLLVGYALGESGNGALSVIGGASFDAITVTGYSDLAEVGATNLTTSHGNFNDCVDQVNEMTPLYDDLTAMEIDRLSYNIVTQLYNMGSNTVSPAQWGYITAMNQSVSSAAAPSFASLTLAGDFNGVNMYANSLAATTAVSATNLTGTSTSGGFYGRIDPNSELYPHSWGDSAYVINKFEYRQYTTEKLGFYNGSTLYYPVDVVVNFVVIGKKCTFSIYPTSGGNGCVVWTPSSSFPVASDLTGYLTLDLSDAKYSRIWQVGGMFRYQTFPLIIERDYDSLTGLLTREVYNPAVAMMPCNQTAVPGLLYKGISMGKQNISTLKNHPAPTVITLQQVSAGNKPILRLYPQVWTWITE